MRTGDLSDCRKLYFDETTDQSPRYRIVYRLLPTAERPTDIEVLAIGLKLAYQDRDLSYIYTLVAEKLGRLTEVD